MPACRAERRSTANCGRESFRRSGSGWGALGRTPDTNRNRSPRGRSEDARITSNPEIAPSVDLLKQSFAMRPDWPTPGRGPGSISLL